MGETQPYLHRMKIGALSPKLTKRVYHSPVSYGLDGTGDGVSILIIDSGVPDHAGIKDGASVNFTNTPNSKDLIGHSTVIAGLIVGDDSSIRGIASDVQVYFAKAVDDHGVAKYDAVIASILWGIIKAVDIILLPLSSDIDSGALHETVKKAYEGGICVISPTGDSAKTSFPALYDEVLAVGALTTKKIGKLSAEGQLNLVGEELSSCYLEQTYVTASGSACAAAIAAGLCAVIIEDKRDKKQKIEPSEIYDCLIGLNRDG